MIATGPFMKTYLKSTETIDWRNPSVLSKAEALASGKDDAAAVAKCCFEWVRDEIKHINDYDIQEVACSASAVLETGSGICYAKSHLLAALLRANSIPAGFCYQRLSLDGMGPPFSLHGLNAVYLSDYGWYRLDARGNKEMVNARFTPPREQLAFSTQMEGEADFAEIWPDPLPLIIEALKRYQCKDELWKNLPDIRIVNSVL